MQQYLSLSELHADIRQAIAERFDAPLWIRAEISELKENRSGHCYWELVEKDPQSDNLLAKARANCWASTYRMLKPYFEQETGETLRAGLLVLIAVNVEFHELYGFSLTICDIDPVFTVGELAARRAQIIQRLEEEGVAQMNRQLPFPEFPQRIAIISSETAAGYGDFCNQLHNNRSGLVFYTKLFPALMQGEQAETSIIEALDKIYSHMECFDLLVIIRGGGAVTDLACFDSYNLALNCAQFPLPIVSGIGHQRDVSILDRVAHSPVKTPTAAAELLIQSLERAEENILGNFKAICRHVSDRLVEERNSLFDLKMRFHMHFASSVSLQKQNLQHQKMRLVMAARQCLLVEKNRIDHMEKEIELCSPFKLFEKGYSRTFINGEVLRSLKQLQPDDCIKTFVSDGSFESRITNLSPQKEKE